MHELVLSIDDFKGAFKILKDGCAKSIFETNSLSFLKDMHNKYGVVFVLFCSCKHKGYKLEMMPDCYKEEFVENSEWLRFGFHCYDEDRIDYELEEFINHFEYYKKNIYRITGQSGDSTMLRLHEFAGSREICEYLRHQGVKLLFSSDDWRSNYYLCEEQNFELYEKKQLFDSSTGMMFVKSCLRIENEEDVYREIQEYIKDDISIIPVFTHEWQLDDISVRRRVEDCCRYISEQRLAK